MKVTMRNWRPAAGSQYADRNQSAAGSPYTEQALAVKDGSEAEKTPGAPVQSVTAADRYINAGNAAKDDLELADQLVTVGAVEVNKCRFWLTSIHLTQTPARGL